MKKYLSYVEGNEACFEFGDKGVEKISFLTNFSIPKVIEEKRSKDYVEKIQKSGIPWLVGKSQATEDYVQIFSGTEYSEFVSIIEKHGGKVNI